MLSIEAARDGFTLSIQGRPVIVHSNRRPCIEIGESELSFRQGRGIFRIRRKHAPSRPLKAFRVLEACADSALVDFEGRLRMSLHLAAGRLHLGFSSEEPLNLFRLRIQAFPDEAIYGCGRRRADLDLKGSRLRLWAEKANVSQGAEAGFGRVAFGPGLGNLRHQGNPFPLPIFLSSRNYWCGVDTDAYTILDFRRSHTTLIETWALPREILIGGAESASALLGDLSLALGRQNRLPSWVFDGPWLGVSGGCEAIDRVLALTHEAGIRAAALNLHDWCPGDERYSGIDERLARCKKLGTRLIGRADPILLIDDPRFVEARREGFCVRNGDGREYLVSIHGVSAALIDLTNPRAFEWAKELLKRELLGRGFSGWASDFAECLPTDVVLDSREDPRLAHNRWPVLWSRACREAIEESGKTQETLFLMGSTWFGSSRFSTVLQMGERTLGFAKNRGLPSLVPEALSLGMSGIGFIQAEISGGGEGSAHERDCLFRWVESAVFSPFFSIKWLGGVERGGGLESDGELLAFVARMSEVYAALKPYHVATAEEYLDRGLPPIRHPYIHYEGTAVLHRYSSQYLYGRDLLVGPVMDYRREYAELELPEDEWIHLWSSRRFRGGAVTVEAPRGCPAVFYRAASPFASLFDAIRRTVRWA